MDITDLGEKLIDNSVANTSTVVCTTTLLEDSIQLVENDDVKSTFIPLFLVLLLGIREQLSDVLLALTNKLVQDLGSVDDLRLAGVEHLADLTGHQRLARARRSVEQQSLDNGLPLLCSSLKQVGGASL